MATQFAEDRREVLRVRYPDRKNCPHLKVLHYDFHVLDLSEDGIRFTCPDTSIFVVGKSVAADLQFPGGLDFPIDGTVVRVDSDGVIVALRHPVPRDVISGMGTDRRAYFRLRYPSLKRPVMISHARQWEVSEVSVHGLRFRAMPSENFPAGTVVSARITFLDHTTLDITGKVLRIHQQEVVLALVQGIPDQRIMQEQRILIQRFKA
ncbi:MAG TPA: PilZ domain-containing protein [Armatimonadota bacterium]